MANNLQLEYVSTREHLIIKILVMDYRGPPYETTRIMVPWALIHMGVKRAAAKVRRRAAKKKNVPKNTRAKRSSTKRGRR